MTRVLGILLILKVEKTLFVNYTREGYRIDLPLIIIALRVGCTDLKLAFDRAVVSTVPGVVLVSLTGPEECFPQLVLEEEPHGGLEGGPRSCVDADQVPVIG